MKNDSGWGYRPKCWMARAHGQGAIGLALAVAVSLASGCMSGGPAPGSVRNTAQTAPADLQLACASAAATSLGVDSSSVLPVSSSQIDGRNYHVDLDARGTRATCIVDAAGNVLSVKKV